MVRSLIYAVFASLAVSVAHAAHPLSIDDYLALESTGGGAGHGRRIVWEQAAPYDQIGYYGLGHIGAWGSSGFTLRTVNIDTGRPQPLFEPEPGVSYWFDSFSPEGRYVAFYAARHGRFFMGAYDTENKRVRTFAKTPLVRWFFGRESPWLSNDTFVFAAHDGDDQPLDAARPNTGQELARRWDRAWHGGVSVSVDKTGLGSTNQVRWKEGGLYKANARTGEIIELAKGKFDSLRVSADGQYLAGLREAYLAPNPTRAAGEGMQWRAQLVLFDLRRGNVPTPIAPDKFVLNETLAWAPDHNRLAFFAWNEGEGVRDGIYYAYDVETRALTPYPHHGLDLASERERGLHQRPERVMWVGGRLAIFARTHESLEHRFTFRDVVHLGVSNSPGKADWFLLGADGAKANITAQFREISSVPLDADAHSIAILADGDVWRVGPDRKPENLTVALEPPLTLTNAMRLAIWHRPFAGQAILVSGDAEKPGFALIDFRLSRATLIPSPAHGAEMIGSALGAGAVLFRWDHDNGVDLTLRRVGGDTITIGRLNKHMSQVERSEWTTIKYKVKLPGGEREIESCMLLPPGYRAGTRLPIIVDTYPNRGASCLWSRSYRTIGRQPGFFSEHLLAARGYIVLQPNSSAEFVRTRDGPLAGLATMTQHAVQAVVDQGYGDGARVGLIGFSQGGFSSLWLATQMQLVKATVSINGWSDMYVHYFDTTYLDHFQAKEFAGAVERYESMAGTDFPIGKKPYDDPLAYILPSPVFNSPTVSAPIMLIHSDMDGFALQQYERMYVALKQQGKPAKLLRYWGEGHGPSSPGNVRHMLTQTFAWFDCYVMETRSACDP